MKLTLVIKSENSFLHFLCDQSTVEKSREWRKRKQGICVVAEKQLKNQLNSKR